MTVTHVLYQVETAALVIWKGKTCQVDWGGALNALTKH